MFGSYFKVTTILGELLPRAKTHLMNCYYCQRLGYQRKKLTSWTVTSVRGSVTWGKDPSHELLLVSEVQLPEAKTHLMLSYLASPSMGSMVPRTAVRWGTIPYTVHRSRSCVGKTVTSPQQETLQWHLLLNSKIKHQTFSEHKLSLKQLAMESASQVN